MDQAAISSLLVARGQAGEIVVRLKGGDPFVFARGGEEAQALLDAGVPFEVVPGVTSAIAVPAYAGIPLTMRHSSTSFTVITGHEDPEKGGELDWDAVARLGGTIVI
jgi:uroporphyrinogen III methyltransferase/synthase